MFGRDVEVREICSSLEELTKQVADLFDFIDASIFVDDGLMQLLLISSKVIHGNFPLLVLLYHRFELLKPPDPVLFLFLPNNFLYAIVPLILLLLDLYYESIDLVVVLGIANVMRQLIYGYHNQHFYQKHAEKYEVDAEAQAEHYCGPHEH